MASAANDIDATAIVTASTISGPEPKTSALCIGDPSRGDAQAVLLSRLEQQRKQALTNMQTQIARGNADFDCDVRNVGGRSLRDFAHNAKRLQSGGVRFSIAIAIVSCVSDSIFPLLLEIGDPRHLKSDRHALTSLHLLFVVPQLALKAPGDHQRDAMGLIDNGDGLLLSAIIASPSPAASRKSPAIATRKLTLAGYDKISAAV
jgi:hypothetical protein